MTRGLSFYRLGEGAELVEGDEVTQEGGAEVVFTNVEEPIVAETVHTPDELLTVEEPEVTNGVGALFGLRNGKFIPCNTEGIASCDGSDLLVLSIVYTKLAGVTGSKAEALGSVKTSHETEVLVLSRTYFPPHIVRT